MLILLQSVLRSVVQSVCLRYHLRKERPDINGLQDMRGGNGGATIFLQGK